MRLASPTSLHDIREKVRLVQPCLTSATLQNVRANDVCHALVPWTTMDGPWFFLPTNHMTYGHPCSADVLFYGREDALQGVPDLCDP
jgi:hypothetical protein